MAKIKLVHFGHRTCEDRADIIRRFEGKDLEDKEGCASVYLKCCLEIIYNIKPKESGQNWLLYCVSKLSSFYKFPWPSFITVNYASRPFFKEVSGRSNDLEPDELDDFLSDEDLGDLESGIRERKDFRETWLWDSGVIGPNGILEQSRGLPDSITTWIVQAVGLSGKGGGMCIAEPKKIVAFQDVFIDVKMPYNVVKNEQIEIPVTVFNYGPRRLMVSQF